MKDRWWSISNTLYRHGNQDTVAAIYHMSVNEVIKPPLRRMSYAFHRGKVFLRGLYHDQRRAAFPYNPYRVYAVDPTDVTYVQRGDPESDPFTEKQRFEKYTPLVTGGDWDQQVVHVENTQVYRGLHQRYVHGSEWEDTVLHPDVPVETDRSYRTKYDRMDERTFRERTREISKLHDSLKTEGCLPWHELGNPLWDELTINVGRDGRLIRNSSGLHRLVLAKILDLDVVPARVLVTHAELDPDSLELRPYETRHAQRT